MGKQRYWLFKTVFTENNQFERIMPGEPVTSGTNVPCHPLFHPSRCSYPPVHRHSPPLSLSLPLHRLTSCALDSANYFSINWNWKGSIRYVIRFNRSTANLFFPPRIPFPVTRRPRKLRSTLTRGSVTSLSIVRNLSSLENIF